MLIQHIGHAEFLIETESGYRIVTDPYDASCGYPVRPVRADAALVSHHHHDHDAVENLTGEPTVIDMAGEYTPSPEVRVRAIQGYHDNAKGSLRGGTLLFAIEAEGLKLVHLGDLGDRLSEEQIKVLRDPDILMIPVGGHFTIDGQLALETARTLNARITLPMHYQTAYTADWPITGPEAFLEGMDTGDIVREAEAFRVTRDDLVCQPKVVLFRQGTKG